MIDFTVVRTTTASIVSAFDAMTDHRSIADYAWAVRRSILDREGSPAPNGVGARRRLVSYGATFVEQVVEYQPPHRWAYSVLSGAPVRDHLGTVDLVERPSGVEVTWHVRAAPVVWGTGWLLTPPSRWLIVQLLEGALARAERS